MEILFPRGSGAAPVNRRPVTRPNGRNRSTTLIVVLLAACSCPASSRLSLTASAGDPKHGGAHETAEPAAPAPFFELRSHQSRYFGPVGKRLPVDQANDVPIGYFGPSDPNDPLHGRTWRAAERAIARANAEGGYQGRPFRLVPAWSHDPWGTGVSQLAQLVYREHIWAIVGGIDGPSTHLAEQIVAKARVPLVSPISTDKTVNLANVPWMYSLAPGDHLIAPVLAAGIEEHVGTRPLVMLTANDHDSYLLAREVRKALAHRQLHPRYKFVYDPAQTDLEPLLRECLAAQPHSVLVMADAVSSSRVVRALREAGFAGCIFGGPALGRDTFVASAGEIADPVVFPLMCESVEPDSPSLPPQGGGQYSGDLPRCENSGGFDDYAALLTDDAVQLVIEAIRSAGLNRAAINTALRENSPTRGLSGRIDWDGLGTNTRTPSLATIRQGKVVPLVTANDALTDTRAVSCD